MFHHKGLEEYIGQELESRYDIVMALKKIVSDRIFALALLNHIF